MITFLKINFPCLESNPRQHALYVVSNHANHYTTDAQMRTYFILINVIILNVLSFFWKSNSHTVSGFELPILVLQVQQLTTELSVLVKDKGLYIKQILNILHYRYTCRIPRKKLVKISRLAFVERNFNLK